MVDDSGVTFTRCLNSECNKELYRSGPGPLGGNLLVRPHPPLKIQDGTHYMACPHCGAKNAFEVGSRPPGQGVEVRRLSRLLDELQNSPPRDPRLSVGTHLRFVSGWHSSCCGRPWSDLGRLTRRYLRADRQKVPRCGSVVPGFLVIETKGDCT